MKNLLPKTKTLDTGEPIVRTYHWVKWADSDYLAARTLLLGRMLVQGCGLANTAVEKYLKARCAYLQRPIPRTHEVTRLYSEVQKHGGIAFLLNHDFLQFLEKAYALRYPDDIPDGFNIAMNQMKILAELDRTVFEITNSFTFDEGTSEFVLARAKRTGDMRFFSKNVVLNPDKAALFFNEDCQSFEFRNSPPLVHQIEYLSPRVSDDGRFDEEGAVFIPDKGYKMVFPRGRGKITYKPLFDWPPRD